MFIQVFSGTAEHVATKLACCEQASFVSVHSDCTVDISLVQFAGSDTVFHGATSCLGAMTGTTTSAPVAAFVISDSEGDYGSALRPLGDNPKAAAQAATRAALQGAGRPGEAPDLVWLSSAPGSEEAVIEGIQAITGPEVPIIGGSAADNTNMGDWCVFDAAQAEQNGVIVSVLFCSSHVSFAYLNGCAPTSHNGTVTSATGRILHEIDHRPALDVYRQWTHEVLPHQEVPNETSAILSDSILHPLGREVMHVRSVPHYLLFHPARAWTNGDIELSALVSEGEVLTKMSGTFDGLMQRAGRVADLALRTDCIPAHDVKGALMIYCSDYRLTLQDRLDDVVSDVNDVLKGAPFVAAFTFGEQCAIVGSGNKHSNLIVSCIVFT